MEVKEIAETIESLNFEELAERRGELVSAIKGHGKEKSKLAGVLLDRYISWLQKIFEEDGPAYPAFRFLEPDACIRVTLREPELGADKTVLLKKTGRQFVISEDGTPLAQCSMTLGSVEYIAEADDYIEAGANLLECRRYPTDDKSLVWETIVDAIEVYETGLLHFYRKLGMF
ncbi:MAG: hypothetical protein K9W43_12845 [Candidatus Thorarchaeota archaeon]|nr:hypothetical protein [Candidatus Thorarchaeota archaeon]